MTRSWRSLAEQLLFALGLLALVYTMMISSGLVSFKEVKLMPNLERKKTMIAARAIEVSPSKKTLQRL